MMKIENENTSKRIKPKPKNMNIIIERANKMKIKKLENNSF